MKNLLKIIKIIKFFLILFFIYGILSFFIVPYLPKVLIPLIYIDTFIIPFFFKALIFPLMPLLMKLTTLFTYGDNISYYEIFSFLLEIIIIYILLLIIEKIIKKKMSLQKPI